MNEFYYFNYVCMYVCMYVCVCVCACACVNVFCSSTSTCLSVLTPPGPGTVANDLLVDFVQ